MNRNYTSHLPYYWLFLLALLIAVFGINIIWVKTMANFSQEFYFLMMIPTWLLTLMSNSYETDRLKNFLEKYLESEYPDILTAFREKPVDLLNSDTEQILDLLKEPELEPDLCIQSLIKEAKNINYFMIAVFLSLPLLYLLLVFVILKPV